MIEVDFPLTHDVYCFSLCGTSSYVLLHVMYQFNPALRQQNLQVAGPQCK